MMTMNTAAYKRTSIMLSFIPGDCAFNIRIQKTLPSPSYIHLFDFSKSFSQDTRTTIRAEINNISKLRFLQLHNPSKYINFAAQSAPIGPIYQYNLLRYIIANGESQLPLLNTNIRKLRTRWSLSSRIWYRYSRFTWGKMTVISWLLSARQTLHVSRLTNHFHLPTKVLLFTLPCFKDQ